MPHAGSVEDIMKLPFLRENHKEIARRIVVIAFAILFAALVFRFGTVWGYVRMLVSLASPFIEGFAIAFLLGPVQRKIEALLRATFFKGSKRIKLMHGISAALSVLFFILLIVIFMWIFVPQLVESIKSIVEYITRFLRENSDRLNEILLSYDFISFNGDELVVAWENIVKSQINNITLLLNNLVLISRTIVNFLYEMLVGIITAFYILMDKDHLAAQIKKIGYSAMPRDKIEGLIYWTRRANHIFAGFISGKILDSFIIGVICYVGMLIFHMEYPLLISSVIGITNIIPFFGPFIGWIPSALILLIVNPINALWFTVFVLVLQQLDGNVIGPHILGDSVGVSALSIMIAIVIGSGLFGFAGMVVSVPVYALIYAFARTLIQTRLKQRGLPTNTEEYVHAPEDLNSEVSPHE